MLVGGKLLKGSWGVSYRTNYTPVLERIFPAAVGPGDSVTFMGDFKNYKLYFPYYEPEDLVDFSSNYVRGVEVGGSRCDAPLISLAKWLCTPCLWPTAQGRQFIRPNRTNRIIMYCSTLWSESISRSELHK